MSFLRAKKLPCSSACTPRKRSQNCNMTTWDPSALAASRCAMTSCSQVCAFLCLFHCVHCLSGGCVASMFDSVAYFPLISAAAETRGNHFSRLSHIREHILCLYTWLFQYVEIDAKPNRNDWEMHQCNLAVWDEEYASFAHEGWNYQEMLIVMPRWWRKKNGGTVVKSCAFLLSTVPSLESKSPRAWERLSA